MKQNTTTYQVEHLIVGFGFSIIPLLRELDRTQTSYTIISDQNSIWKRLQQRDRLDFDLVSSYYTSFYSFDIVKKRDVDFYPTAKSFYQMHLDYFEKYKDQIIDDVVETIDNYTDHSLVHTKNGSTYQAKNVVVATGFKRKVFGNLLNFDYNISNKTIVFNTIGDSANLMISKLVPRGNKIICLQNGFFSLDKIFSFEGITYTLDQMEFHNLGLALRYLYPTLSLGSFGLPIHLDNPILRLLSLDFLSPIFCPHTLHTKYKTGRSYNVKPLPKPIPNGALAIKYWPIDKYAEEFSDQIETAINKGYLLNDFAYFVDKGFVDLWSKAETLVNREHKNIEWKGRKIDYDLLIEGDIEVPNLPRIRIDGQHEYEYIYKENYLGVIPQKLNNIFFLGFTRPSTGGLANITEMQSLFIHKMLTKSTFHAEIHQNLTERIDVYNKSFYTDTESKKVDHLVYYGFYTEEVARVMKINHTPWTCRSPKDLIHYFFFPNNAFKYRQSGEYKVDGAKELVAFITQKHDNYSGLIKYNGCFLLYIGLFLELSIVLFSEGNLNIYQFGLALICQSLFFRIYMIPVQNYFGYLKMFYLSFAMISMLVWGSVVIFPLLILDFVITYVMRSRGFRYFFNDLKNKSHYDNFFEQYVETFLAVQDKKNQKTAK